MGLNIYIVLANLHTFKRCSSENTAAVEFKPAIAIVVRFSAKEDIIPVRLATPTGPPKFE